MRRLVGRQISLSPRDTRMRRISLIGQAFGAVPLTKVAERLLILRHLRRTESIFEQKGMQPREISRRREWLTRGVGSLCGEETE